MVEINSKTDKIGESELSLENSLEVLPNHLIDKILTMMPEANLSDVALVNSRFKSRVNLVLRKAFFSLDSEIDKEMENIRNDLELIPTSDDIIILRLPLLRSYFVLEMLKGEMRVLKILNKKKLSGNDERIFNMAKLLHLYRTAFDQAKSRLLPPWHINDAVTVSLMKLTKHYLDTRGYQEGHDELFGVRLIEIFDVFIKKRYEINVRYYPLENSCSIEVRYEVVKPTYVIRPPSLSDEPSLTPTAEDKIKILQFLVNLVRINNRVTLREEQYYRELEGTRGIQGHEFAFGIGQVAHPRSHLLSRSLRVYNSLTNPTRKISIVDNTFEVHEYFCSQTVLGTDSHNKGFKAHVLFTCSMDVLPKNVGDSWKRLEQDLFSGALSSNEPLWTELAQRLRDIHNLLTSSDQLQSPISANSTTINATLEAVMNLFPREVEEFVLRFKDP